MQANSPRKGRRIVDQSAFYLEEQKRKVKRRGSKNNSNLMKVAMDEQLMPDFKPTLERQGDPNKETYR